ncbi:MAG TPA: class E sortase [Propionibacteriaceae bacterium]|nr:class E sortase [Propionibacteriaceae bacterium]
MTSSIREKGTDTQAAQSKRRRQLTTVGVTLLVVGLCCLGWVAYQYVGTNLIAQREFRTEASRLRAQWAEAQRTAPERLQRVSTTPGEAMGLLRIPALGEAYEVPILNGSDLGVLAKGVGHYASTAQAGQIGNFALAGYRVTHGQPFARLLELNTGDEIIVETQDATFTYVLDEPPRQLTVKDTDTWVIDPVPGKPELKPTQALITLTTCPDLFHSSKRSVGFGHLVRTERK